MNKIIRNEHITLTVSTLGAEMQSIKSDREYLWQGDKDSWSSKAINLFPWVARLTEGKYTYSGNEYFMESHGFTAASEFTAKEISNEEIGFTLKSNETTLKKYPFNFIFEINYKLSGREIEITYRVNNIDDKTMFFAIGGHPGFIVPMENCKKFSDYSITFSQECSPIRVGMSEDCFVTDDDMPFPLLEGKTLNLKQDLFDNDAIILKNMAEGLTLSSSGKHKITVKYKGFPYLGIWNWPKKDVNYICIEPWTSLPARKNIVESLEGKSDLLSLESGKSYELAFTIAI